MRGLDNRLNKLESRWNPLKEPLSRFRLVASKIGGPLNLEKSRCTRTLGPTGNLFEVVVMEGSADELSDDELDQFVERFPVVAGRK
jgi:hypothetical protein